MNSSRDGVRLSTQRRTLLTSVYNLEWAGKTYKIHVLGR